VALNWLYHHSAADCLILGASRLEQLEQNLATLAEGPVPEPLLLTCDTVWATLRGVTPKYNR
jgi:aflatoxin B1 aldehyde reductase